MWAGAVALGLWHMFLLVRESLPCTRQCFQQVLVLCLDLFRSVQGLLSLFTTDLCCAESVVHQQGEADPSPLPAFATSLLCRAPSHAPGHGHHGRHPAMEVDTSANLPSIRLTRVKELFQTSANVMLTCTFHRSSAEQAQAGSTAFLITSHLT